MPRTQKQKKITRKYSTDVKEKIKGGERWRIQLDVDDDNALGLYEWKEKNPDGGDYRRKINGFIREGLKKEKQRLKK